LVSNPFRIQLNGPSMLPVRQMMNLGTTAVLNIINATTGTERNGKVVTMMEATKKSRKERVTPQNVDAVAEMMQVRQTKVAHHHVIVVEWVLLTT
jgi:hypothetical protein